MPELKIQEAKNGSAQLSEGRYFLMVNKYRIKRGANTGKALVAVRMSHLETENNNPDNSIFVEDKVFLLSQKQLDVWIGLLMQVSNKQISEIKAEGVENGQAKL